MKTRHYGCNGVWTMMEHLRRRAAGTRLLSRLTYPIFLLIVTFIALFSTAASYMMIRVQNDHSLKMAEQSLQFVYRNIRYQFDTMDNLAAFVLNNPALDSLLKPSVREAYEAINDYYTLQLNLENMSLLSLLNDFGSAQSVKQSYVVSMALEPESGLYALAPEAFYPVTGIFKSEGLDTRDWYSRLKQGDSSTVWWGEKTNVLSGTMIYSARKKGNLSGGRSIGTVIIGADTGSIKGVFENAPLEEGYHLLLDEGGRVIYSEQYGFLEDLSAMPYMELLKGKAGTALVKLNREQHRMMYETMENGWRLLAVVPERHLSRYTYFIAALGAATAVAASFIAAYLLRKIVVRVTVPITKLVHAMQRPEVVDFKEPLPCHHTGIYEVDELNQQFAGMLVTIHRLIERSFTEEIERKQLQLELLQAQINPHFLYNTLDLINCRAILAGDRETSRIVLSLADVFRYGLNQGQTWISLEDEIKQAEAYLHIQSMMLEQLAVVTDVPRELTGARIVHLILQPLAENAVKHGFAFRREECLIHIAARTEGQALILRVTDNGRGCDPGELNRLLRQPPKEPGQRQDGGERGYGILNVHRRIQLYCGEGYGLRYLAAERGTVVEAVLPYDAERSVLTGGCHV
ncbi:cache domain-containing sensor histidine kinase [Paenibacillus mesotrionivorans]|uniref:Sensor histidine kinase n=1 Tax=Paenibacillus mesotrionivorans TaxID=3160968 RepID=A0ACC7P478_9BACL